MGPRGRGSVSNGRSRGGRGGSRGRGGSGGRGRGRGGFRGRGRGGATTSRNGFRTSRVDDVENTSDVGDRSAEDDEDDDIAQDEEQISEGAASASEDETLVARQSYTTLLQALNARSEKTEPPRKKRKVETRVEETQAVEEPPAQDPATPGTNGHDMENTDAGLAEVVEDEDAEHDADSDQEDVVLHDPFEKHYANVEEAELNQAISAVKEKQRHTLNSLFATTVKKSTIRYTATDNSSETSKRSEKDLHLKRRLVEGGSRVWKTLSAEEKDLAGEISSYRDIQYALRTVQRSDQLRHIASLHALNHVFKTRDRVLKNNAKASQQDGDDSQDIRDQGFTRPKVLIILPTKQACVRYAESIAEICEAEQQENRSRFRETYSTEEDETWDHKSEDFRELFGGNHEEDFRVGLKFTRKTIKYFSGFYNSDIIFGSALGLMRTITTGGGGSKDKKKTHDADFLSSIEVVIVDHASAIQMQNWQHLEYVFTQLNLLPRDSHGCDFSRVRNWYLDGNAPYLRQTILFTAYNTPEINALISTQTHNIAGLTKYTPTYTGAMLSLPPSFTSSQPSQTFLRFDSTTPQQDADSRFTYFTTTILPPLLRQHTKGILIFIPTYADFTRLRNFFATSPTTTSLSFGSISEYTPVRDVSRARSHFMNGRHSLLIYSERAHHHFRYRLRGIKKILFYGVPENPIFWSEIVDLLSVDAESTTEKEEEKTTKRGKGKGAVRALFSKWDALKLERIVGSERVGRLVMGEKGADTFEFV